MFDTQKSSRLQYLGKLAQHFPKPSRVWYLYTNICKRIFSRRVLLSVNPDKALPIGGLHGTAAINSLPPVEGGAAGRSYHYTTMRFPGVSDTYTINGSRRQENWFTDKTSKGLLVRHVQRRTWIVPWAARITYDPRANVFSTVYFWRMQNGGSRCGSERWHSLLQSDVILQQTLQRSLGIIYSLPGAKGTADQPASVQLRSSPDFSPDDLGTINRKTRTKSALKYDTTTMLETPQNHIRGDIRDPLDIVK
ncbi:hypothetical protein PAAG_12261 [Paracoccidioides lutzii Pb01]|uniref:Uncharacterized protein n=1 Tax=Paracoccidioides lutzii (strain ATCC MYA-826 / Pb01) TaxID=502779 RepID=A0A0A2V3W8_PARBA|nr:hypothetical protein PAAG_12261 [Paracoccidioides lutzii Pb01]KGQ01067.1 hypothetical protein PAAG_12261 [Paracoccidioides lutzii Pb01]